MNTRRLILFFLFSGLGVQAQSFRGEGVLPRVEKNGFYRIPLTPELSEYFAPGYANLRLLDGNGKEVPYLLRHDAPRLVEREFREYAIEKKQIPNCCTEVLLKNPDRSAINNVRLLIRNAEVVKNATLAGSDDRKNWFVIKDEFTLSPVAGESGTAELNIIRFPLSNYLFYLLRLADSTHAPINILKAGYFVVHTENGEFTPVPAKVVISADAKKQTTLKLSFDTLRLVDRIVLQMKANQPYFLRSAALKEAVEQKRNGTIRIRTQVLSRFEVSSTHPTQIDLPAGKHRQFWIEIEDEDNPPLELVSLEAFQLNRYMVAWLSAGQSYSMKIGASDLRAPSYDLKFFKDSISNKIPVLQAGAVYLSKPDGKALGFFNKTALIWTAITIVVALLAYMTFHLVGDLRKNTRS